MHEGVLERVEEAIARIDELASGKGLRAAQRRALQDCKRGFVRISMKLKQTPGEPSDRLICEVLATMAKTCELANAYFCKRREQ